MHHRPGTGSVGQVAIQGGHQPFGQGEHFGVDARAVAVDETREHAQGQVRDPLARIGRRSFQPVEIEQIGISPARRVKGGQLRHHRGRVLGRTARHLVAGRSRGQILEQDHVALLLQVVLRDVADRAVDPDRRCQLAVERRFQFVGAGRETAEPTDLIRAGHLGEPTDGGAGVGRSQLGISRTESAMLPFPIRMATRLTACAPSATPARASVSHAAVRSWIPRGTERTGTCTSLQTRHVGIGEW